MWIALRRVITIFVLVLSSSVLVNSQSEVLRVGVLGDQSTLNPYTYASVRGLELTRLQYDSLYQLDADGVAQPWLVTDITYSDDNLTISLTLREDVLFHDGESLTADDVAFTLQYFKDNPQVLFTPPLNPIESVTATSANTVDINLTSPTPLFELRALATTPILPEHIWSTIENPLEDSADIALNVATGPFQLVQYEPDQFYRFEAHADYFAGTPMVDELVVILYADVTGALAALQANEVDALAQSVGPEQIDFLSVVPDIEVIQGPLFETRLLGFDTQRAPFDQVAVRQAISYAIDREDIVETVYLGAATPGNPGWTHPESPFYNDSVMPVYDVAAANTLLDEAGYVDSDDDGIREFDGNPMSFSLTIDSSRVLLPRVGELVREMLAEIGMDIQVDVVDSSVWSEAVWPGFDVSNGRNYEMSLWRWGAPLQADPLGASTLVHSEPGQNFFNLTGYDNPEMNALLDELLVTVDEDRQAELLDELQRFFAEDVPLIPILHPDGIYPYRPASYDNWLFTTGQGIMQKTSFLSPEDRP